MNELSQAPDRKKIKVSASFTQGAQLREALASAHLELFTQPAPVDPILNGGVSTRTVTDADTGAVTRAPLAAGDMCVLTGRNIKLAGTDTSVGILLTSVANPSTTFFIKPDRVSPNEPKTLQFVLPAGMDEGAWKVKVTTQYGSGGGRLTNEPRSIIMESPLILGEDTGGGDEGGGEVIDPMA